jgi:ADP-heptose:LPS heptosyltransferase
MNLLKQFLIIIKSLLFYLFDSLALWKVPSPQLNELELVLLIRQDAIGDFVMWLDTAKEYRNIFPPDKYKIVLAGNKIWCDLAEELTYWDMILMVDVKQFKTFSRYRWDFLRKVRNLGVQISIQPTFSREFYHGDALVRASGALRKVSSAGDMANRNWLKQFIADCWHTELIPASTGPLTELERNAEFFSGLTDYPHLTSYPKLDIPEFWLSSEWKEKIFYILVPGTSGAVVGKEWPPAFFSDLATKIFRQTGWEGFICGTKQENSLGEQILKQCDAPLQNLCGQTTLMELAGLLSQSRLTISNDTGSVFLSSAVGTLSVCILGGGHFGRFVPYPDLPGQTNHLKTVYHKMPCYGCNWVCIFPIIEGEPTPCIANISVGVVWSKVRPLLIKKTF